MKKFDLTKLKIGTKLWSPQFGEGMVIEIEKDSIPVCVQYESGRCWYRKFGVHKTTKLLTIAPSREAYLSNPENPFEGYSIDDEGNLIPPSKELKDKQLVWCWDNFYMTTRAVRFYDAKNDSTFQFNGERTGTKYQHYKPYKGRIPKWAKKARKLLKD